MVFGDETATGGWNELNVHFGSQNQLVDPIPSDYFLLGSDRHQEGTKWFSEQQQDLTVARIFDFEPSLYYIDLAANDAVWSSNTFSLERNLGWHGLCVEPNPYYWHRLGFRTSCTVVGAIIGGHVDLEEIDFAVPIDKVGGPTGGIVGPEFNNKVAEKSDRRYTMSLLSLLKRFRAPKIIDYLSIDVEGAEHFILKSYFKYNPNPLEYKFRCISIEGPSDALAGILESTNHHKVAEFSQGDSIWVHGDFLAQAKANLAKHPDGDLVHARKTIVEQAAALSKLLSSV